MFANKKCTPCVGGTQPLTGDEAKTRLTQVLGWELSEDGKAIQRRFAFKDFAEALAFTNKIGEIAETENHHPDIKLGWGYVECLLWTHAIGGLHENDFIMASKISALLRK